MAGSGIVDRLFARASNSERRAAVKQMERARDGYVRDRRTLRDVELQLSERIEAEWGRALRDLEVLLLEANGIGSQFHLTHSERLAKGLRANLATALISLHARAGVTAAEILYLARGGFPQGALARLRTLSEISAFSSFIARHGEETAARFCDYAVIEILKNEKARRAGNDPGTPGADLKELEDRRAALIAKYGSAFGKDYGWAAHALRVSDVRLSTILRSMSTTDNASPIFRDASLWIHSSTVGVLANTQNVGGTLRFVTGPNEDRLGTQLHGTALALLFSTAHLIPLAGKDRALNARALAIFGLAEAAIESAKTADALWLRRRPYYRRVPDDKSGK